MDHRIKNSSQSMLQHWPLTTPVMAVTPALSGREARLPKVQSSTNNRQPLRIESWKLAKLGTLKASFSVLCPKILKSMTAHVRLRAALQQGSFRISL